MTTQGMRVTILGRRINVIQAMADLDPENLFAVAADETHPDQVDAALKLSESRFGPVEVLINNAGQAQSAPFLKMDMNQWQQMLSVNLTGTMICSQAVLPSMLKSGWGRIVNVASTAGQIGYSYVSAYCAAKHGVLGLTKSLALELATKGITVNAVCPGFTETDLVRESIDRVVAKTGRTPEQAMAEFVKTNPQGRLVQPEQVADAVIWLCSEGASAVTGQAISVSGGEVM
jgi:NAD(P)-dependent dehydrogenase (short-subunit alcohol dehydrogenase family)